MMKPKAIVKLVSEQSPEPVPSHGGPAVLTRWVLSIENVVLGQEHCRHKWSANRAKYTRIDHAPRNLVDLFNQLCEKFDPPDASQAGVGVETPPPSTHVLGIEEGIERAARYIEKQRDEYVQEYGMYDGTTGVTEFSNGGEEYLSTLEELIDGIRALATTEGKDNG